MDRRDSFQSDASSMWQQCVSHISQNFGSSQWHDPMAIADSGASHVILPQSALFDSKSAKSVNLRLAAGETHAVEEHREIFAEQVAIPLCPLGRVIQTLQLTAIWTPQTLTLNCVNKSGTAQGLTQCPIKGDTPYFAAVEFWMLRRALQLQRKGQKHFPPQFLETAVLGSYCRRTRLEDGSKSSTHGGPGYHPRWGALGSIQRGAAGKRRPGPTGSAASTACAPRCRIGSGSPSDVWRKI